MPQITCRQRRARCARIKGAILLAEFTSGPGYVMDRPSEEDEGRGLGRDRPLFIGGSAWSTTSVFFPSSAILAGMYKWPAAFFARGLWDYAAALQGTMDSYSRVRGPKELVVVRAPHPVRVLACNRAATCRRNASVAFAGARDQRRERVDGGASLDEHEGAGRDRVRCLGAIHEADGAVRSVRRRRARGHWLG